MDPPRNVRRNPSADKTVPHAPAIDKMARMKNERAT
jgi:hypothetical protein